MENLKDSSSSSSSSLRRSGSLTSELHQGKEIARQLQILLNEPHPSNSQEIRGFLVQQIIESFNRAVSIAQQSDPAPSPSSSRSLALPKSDSPLSGGGSPRSEDPDPTGEDNRRRKVLPRWTIKAQVSHETGFEGPPADGYSWRKYGQKDILGATHPRSYFRCALSQAAGCPARKQVQRTDEDPTIFEVSYRGLHTCTHQVSNPNHPSSSSQPQDQPPDTTVYYPQLSPQLPTQPPAQNLISFETTNTYQPQSIDFNNRRRRIPSGTYTFDFHGSSSATTNASSSAIVPATTAIGIPPANPPVMDHDLPFDDIDFDGSEFFH